MVPTCIKAAQHQQHNRRQKRRNEVNLNPPFSTATISPSTFPIVATPMIMLAAASSSTTTWLRARRSRYLFLLLCSPILILLLCATFPILCAAELCLQFCRLRRKTVNGADDEEEQRLRQCEEGRGGSGCAAAAATKEEVGLLQRYLEDQLLLVGSVYDCGDDSDDDLYHEIHDYDNDTNTTPLLA